MEVERILRDFGLILGAGLVAQFLATFLRIPEMILLVAVGALVGPTVLGIVENPLGGVGAQLLFNIGVALILFHGGVGISLRVISRTALGLGLLVLPGVLISSLVVGLVVAPIFGVIPAAVASILLARGVEGPRSRSPWSPSRSSRPSSFRLRPRATSPGGWA